MASERSQSDQNSSGDSFTRASGGGICFEFFLVTLTSLTSHPNEDRDLESVASDGACLELSKQGFKMNIIHRGQEIELQSQVSLSRE